ncbi:hypothetical protein [Phenylobacterium sp.]|uniref:hypothetical protein n=1 Tax=Phenylobacterium sp. TaxID=1871053 RepID=UPI00356317A3
MFAAPAGAQSAAPSTRASTTAALRPTPPTQGRVVGLTGDVLTVTGVGGTAKTFTLASDVRILKLRKIDPSAIQAGSFVATANANQPDGSGMSTEFRVFAPELRGLGEGNGPMSGEAPGTMMTNGTVSAKVVSTPRGREMDVSYGGKQGQGVRHIVIPPNITIREMSSVGRGQIKPGIAVDVRAGQAADGSFVARAILIGENGAPPAS